MTVPPTAPTPPVLLLTGPAEGPWTWRQTRYVRAFLHALISKSHPSPLPFQSRRLPAQVLLDGALDEARTTYSRESINSLRTVGAAMRIQDGDHVLFDLGAPRSRHLADVSNHLSADASEGPLRIHLGATYEEAGVGYQVWDSAIAMAILQRSNLLPSLPASARVIELGAGLGLPGLDLARRGYAVTLTDSRPPLLELAAHNAEATRREQQESGRTWATVSTAHLQWGNDSNVIEPKNDDFDYAIGSDSTLQRKMDRQRSVGVVCGSHPDVCVCVCVCVCVHARRDAPRPTVCYEESSVPALAELIDSMRVATCVIGPATRPSMRALLHHLVENTRLQVTERKLTLVCNNAEKEQLGSTAQSTGYDEMRSAGVHSLIMIQPAATD